LLLAACADAAATASEFPFEEVDAFDDAVGSAAAAAAALALTSAAADAFDVAFVLPDANATPFAFESAAAVAAAPVPEVTVTDGHAVASDVPKTELPVKT
jgi:hypothetical protein